MSLTNGQRPLLLLTGATGLIGHHVLARLLAQGQHAAVLLRGGVSDLPRLQTLLRPFGIDAVEHVRAGALIIVQGDVCGAIATPPIGCALTGILHIAACTRFEADRAGDPYRTNVRGTINLLEWAAAHGIGDVHLVSTAYVCGRCRSRIVRETISDDGVDFHNDYERSKWTAERLCRDWCGLDARRRLTVMRPSIVVGEFATGRTIKFSGFYLTLRAAEAVARLQRQDGASTERVRLRGCGDGRQNIVPVDYVAAMIAAIVNDSDSRGRVHHLVHPNPPTNRAIARAIEEHLNMRCTEFAGSGEAGERNRLERVFDRLASTVEPYIFDTPNFDRRCAQAVERRAAITCPDFDHAALLRLCEFATSNAWRCERSAVEQPTASGDPVEYFDRFLPENIGRSRVAEMHSLCATVRFVLTDMTDGQWVCRFEHGRLAQVHRGSNGLKEDFGYRTTRAVFGQAVAGTLDPQQAFIGRQADVFGDVERALKMAMVLREFNRECPFPREAPRA